MTQVHVTAPGRVNLIGEHTDYNEGFVMPAAIEQAIEISAHSRSDRQIIAGAAGFGPRLSFSLDQLEPPRGKPAWLDYLKAVCWALGEPGYTVHGADLSIESSIPIGAGLSSSAALEVAVAAALAALSGLTIPPTELALLCQKAESEFVGVHCGIMDQFAVTLGLENHALLLDCRSLEYSQIPLELGEQRLLIVDSRVERTLSGSAYNRRRAECEAAVRRLADCAGWPIRSLRDVALEEVKEARRFLPKTLYQRSRYVVEENSRVREAAAALCGGDLASFGYFMSRSHAGLRDLYQVSCPELDLIVETALAVPGVMGARMTGAGFGGCAVALLHKDCIEDTTASITAAFLDRGWAEPHYYRTTAANGVRVKSPPN
ncbi:MAG: galactokinase [Bacillota bacterium]